MPDRGSNLSPTALSGRALRERRAGASEDLSRGIWATHGGQGGGAPLYLEDGVYSVLTSTEPSYDQEGSSRQDEPAASASSPRPDAVKRCEADGWARFRCGGRVRSIPMGRCHAEDCTDCSGSGAKSPTGLRRADNVEALLDADRQGRNVGILILTVPKDRRHLFRYRKDCQAIRKRVLRRIMRAILRMDYGLDSMHPVGDDGVTFHPHHNFLYVAIGRKSPYPTKPQLARIREVWADILGIEESELETKGCEVKYRGEVVIWHKYVKWHETAKRKHMCRYYTRPFPGWAWWRGNSIVPVGRRVKRRRREKPPCGECGKKTHTIIGFTRSWVLLSAASIAPELREEYINQNSVRDRRDLLTICRVLGPRAPPAKVG